MSKQANKKAIGAFVIAALGLAVAAIIIFGSGKFFAKREQFIAYFQGSVKGLRVGAPVVFRGVRVGEVTKMMIYADRHDRSYIIPVMMEIEPDNFKEIGPKVKDMEKYVQDLIKIGLRAQLQIQSLVTGQLMVNFDFHPDTQASLVGDQRIDLAENVTEIPTVQTSLQKLEKTLENIPIGEIADNMNKSLEGIKEFVASEELKKGVLYFNRTIKEIHDFVDHLDEKVDPLSAGVDQTLKDAQMLIRNVNSQVDPLAAGVKKTAAAVTGAADAAQPAVKEVERAFANIAALTGKGSQERRQLDLTLKELQGAARSIKVWAAYLERNPEALIRGKRR